MTRARLNISRYCLLYLLLCTFAFSQDSASAGLRSLRIDAGRVIGEIRSFQGQNGPPSPVMAGLPNLVRQYKELRVNQVRTHDFMGPTEIDSQFTQSNALLRSQDSRSASVTVVQPAQPRETLVR